MPENQQICRHLKVLLWYCVIPSGLEPKSSEPESEFYPLNYVTFVAAKIGLIY